MPDGESRYSIHDVLSRYLELRQQKEDLAERHKAEMAPFNEGMEKIEAWLQAQMNQLGVDNLKVDGVGTAYRSTVTGAKVTDWEKLLALVLESADYDLLVRNVNKTRAQERLAQYGPVDGVEFTTLHRVNVRRG